MTSAEFAELRALAQADALRRLAERPNVAAGCLGKAGYNSIAEANTVRHRMRNRHQGAANAQPYRCTYCANWHLGGNR